MSQLDQYEIDPVFGCFLWTGRLDYQGYPIVFRGKHPVKAYLLIYEANVGPIPKGKVYDHRCKVRACVAPLHALITTQSDNLMRRSLRARMRQPLCAANHDNAYAMTTSAGGRLCRKCHKGNP